MNHRLLAITPVDHAGGAEMALLRLLRGLRSRGWIISLTTPGRGPLRDEAVRSGYGWSRVALGGLGPRQGARAAAAWPRARKLAGRFDVIYLSGGVSGRLLPALPRRPRIVLHIHDIVERVPRFWKRADVVLADSGAVARSLPGLDPHVVLCPVEPDPPEQTPPWPTGNGPVVGFVGRIEPRKGTLDLVRAAPEIRRRVPGARVVVLGDDPYGSAPEYTRAVIASDAVEHYGWSPNAPGLMRHLDILVLPSHQEPFGTVLAEAMAVGTPVVATAVGGLPEVVTDRVTGRLVAPGEPEQLAEAIVDVLEHRDAMGTAARAHARRFYVDDYVERVERLITP
jgi:glycosyltransferase involved in cell wall biosynthesis